MRFLLSIVSEILASAAGRLVPIFIGQIEVAEKVWEFFKGLFKGTINVATTVWNWFTGLFSGKFS